MTLPDGDEDDEEHLTFLEMVFAEYPIEIRYNTEHLLTEANPEWDELDDDQLWRLRDRLGASLVRELPASSRGDVEVTIEEPHDPRGKAAGGEITDSIWLVLRGIEAYVAVRFLADDIKKILSRIRAITGDRVSVTEGGALVIAWAHVAPEGSTADVALEYIAPLRRFTASGRVYYDGWLVGLLVDGEAVIVQVGSDGEVGVAGPGVPLPPLDKAEDG